jgi:hypothetical protein
MKLQEVQRLRAQVSDLKDRAESDAQTNAILEASLVLAVDETKALLKRLGVLESRCSRRREEQEEQQTALTALLDYLDRLEGTNTKRGST